MEQVITTDWMQHVPKILRIGAFLALISIFLPATHMFESVMGTDVVLVIWYFGFFFLSGGGITESGFADEFFADPYDNDYMGIGISSIVLLIIAFIAMNVAAQNAIDERNNKISAGTGLLGGVLALVGPAVYYFGLKEALEGYWTGFDPSIGVYLPIIGGILGIIGAIMAGYAFSLESKREPVEITSYKPAPDKLVMDKESEVTSQQESPTFCKNCGTKLVGGFCQECGQKAEF